jgi:Fe-S oxidoreductase
MSAPSVEKGIQAIKGQIDAPVASFFSACVHCGLCAEACLFYTETGDPKYTPINKVEPMRRIWEREYTLFGKAKAALGLSKEVDADTFAEWETLVYDGCTLCGRC